MQLYDGPSIKGPANNTNYSPSVSEISSVQKFMFINVYFFPTHAHRNIYKYYKPLLNHKTFYLF